MKNIQSYRASFSSSNKAQTDYETLYLAEVYGLQLQANLVVLSCCQTGVGQYAKGEGLMALNRGFIYAGASNVVYTLYKVDDKPSSELMQNFFTYSLDNKSYCSSLHQAKLDMIADENYARPLFWAGYVLVGR